MNFENKVELAKNDPIIIFNQRHWEMDYRYDFTFYPGATKYFSIR